MSVAVLVGIPASLRARIERHVGRRVEIRAIAMKQDGGFKLEVPPEHAARLLGAYTDSVESYEHVMVLLLPYTRIPDEVSTLANILVELKATVIRPTPNSGVSGDKSDWPARSPRLDSDFQNALLGAICRLLDRQFPIAVGEEGDKEIACELIRGLAAHSKMGPNNHSHEDDFWKSRGQTLGPGGRDRIVKLLMEAGILDRKKNQSMGGTGWVYWIADVQGAKTFCPDLEPYFA